ncbi:MAG: type II secretion system protein [Bacilli bacterium]
MNKKGFTLIELLAVIVLIAIISVIVVPSMLSTVDASKNASYNMLVKNIVTASENYYQECEYGDLSDNICTINTQTCTDEEGNSYTYNYIETNLGTLANTGFLTVSDVEEDENNKDKKVVKDPRTDEDLSNCIIIIKKNVEEITDSNGIENTKVTYKIESNSGTPCPKTEEYGG